MPWNIFIQNKQKEIIKSTKPEKMPKYGIPEIVVFASNISCAAGNMTAPQIT
jgi:hypothetical protein